MPSVFASSLFRHKRYTQSLPQCDKAIIKKKRSILVCSVIFVHPLFLHSFWQRPKHIRVFALWNGMMHFTVWSQRKKSFILQSACSSYTNSTEICWTTFEIILCMYVYLYVCVCAECLYTQLWGRVLRYKYCTTGELRRALRSREHFAVPSGGGSDELWWPPIRPLLLHILNRVITITVMNRFLWGA